MRNKETSHQKETTNLPSGYRLDLVDDPCILILRRPDGTIVARFTHGVDPDEIRRVAEEDFKERG